MFGYVNVNREEMTPEEEIEYRGFYCGLCRALGRLGGSKVQLLLNYDVTFLAIVLSGLYEPSQEETSFICAVHPGKRRIAYENPYIEYAAAMDVLLSYHNLMDDALDDNNLAKRTMAGGIKKIYKQVAEEYPRQADAIENMMKLTREAEAAKESNVDVMAGYTGQMLGQLFVFRQDEWQQDLYDLGFHLGKFIYVLDAYLDRVSDEKKGRFNPLISFYKENPAGYETFCKGSLTALMAECARAFERMPILTYASLIRNILYSGVWSKYEYYRIKQEGKSKKEKPSKEKLSKEKKGPEDGSL